MKNLLTPPSAEAAASTDDSSQLAALTRFFGRGLPAVPTSDANVGMTAFRAQEEKAANERIGTLVDIEQHLGHLIERTRVAARAEHGILPAETIATVRSLRTMQRAASEAIIPTPEDGPDYFFAYHARQLQEYRTTFAAGGMVPLPYVQAIREKVLDDLQHGRPVLLHGHTGTGKTELARDAAGEYSSKPPLVVRCHGYMSSGDLFGHPALIKSPSPSALEAVGQVEAATAEWNRLHPHSDDAAKEKAHGIIEERIRRDQGVMVTDFVIGAVYRAAEQGRVLILDEFNAMPAELRLALNDILTRVGGRALEVQENGKSPIEPKDGFGIIATANINTGREEMYTGLNKFNLAQLNRFNPIEYGFLPQNTKGDIKQSASFEEKQIFALALVSLLQEDLTALLPKNGLEQLWKLSQFARLSCEAFVGGMTASHERAFQDNGTPISYRPEVVLSARLLCTLVKSWEFDGFSGELDHYLHSVFISSAIKPSDQRHLYNLAQKMGFFSVDAGWPSGDTSIAHLGSKPFEIEIPRRANPPLDFVDRDTVITQIFGEAPARSNWPSERAREKSDATAIAVALQRVEALRLDIGDLFASLGLDRNPGTSAPDKK